MKWIRYLRRLERNKPDSISTVISYGIQRSGSTLIYQALKQVFPQANVIKTHDFIYHKDYKVVATYRDFRDVLISMWRTLLSKGTKENIAKVIRLTEPDISSKQDFSSMTNEEVVERANWIKCHLSEVLDKYKEVDQHNVLWMQYELFYNNFDYIFSRLSSFFQICIDEGKKNKIKEDCSIEANRRRAYKLKDFSEYDPLTHIHGHHIYEGRVGFWKEFLTSEQKEISRTILGSALERYGYEL